MVEMFMNLDNFAGGFLFEKMIEELLIECKNLVMI